MRDLQSDKVSQMVVIPGIIVNMSKAQIKSTILTVKCSNCGHEKRLEVKSGFSGVPIPRICDN
jgi:DNA replication licensing factor MCM5